MELAASHGYLPLLQELQKDFELVCCWGGHDVFASACSGGHLEIMGWLRSEGCPWDASACGGAAWGGHLETLKWLRSEGCPWDESACEGGAAGGQLEVLKWLRSESCPWNARICAAAAANGHLDVLKYARENGCPWDYTTWLNAAESTREWLQENGCPQSPVYDPSDDDFMEYDSEDGEYW